MRDACLGRPPTSTSPRTGTTPAPPSWTDGGDGQSGLRLFGPAVQEEWKTTPPPGREDPESFTKTIEKIFHVSFLVNISLPFHLSSSLLNYYFQVKERKAAMRLASGDISNQSRPGGVGGRVQPGHHEHHRRITGTQICVLTF